MPGSGVGKAGLWGDFSWQGKKKVGRLENGFFFYSAYGLGHFGFFGEMGAFFVIDSLVFEENAVRKGKRLEFFTRLRI